MRPEKKKQNFWGQKKANKPQAVVIVSACLFSEGNNYQKYVKMIALGGKTSLNQSSFFLHLKQN